MKTFPKGTICRENGYTDIMSLNLVYANTK